MANYELLEKAGIDINSLIKRLMGNEALIRVFADKFLQDNTYDELCASFEASDAKQAEVKSHTLKGMCANMSLEPLYTMFTKQVDLIRSGEYDAAKSMMGDISKAYEISISNMKMWLSEN